jgi:hypothetical protein
VRFSIDDGQRFDYRFVPFQEQRDGGGGGGGGGRRSPPEEAAGSSADQPIVRDNRSDRNGGD